MKRKHEEKSDTASSPAPETKRVRWEGTTATTTEDSDQDDLDGDKICLAAYCQRGRLGCAYYDPLKCVIYILEDSHETSHFELTTTLLEQINPNVLLTSSRSDDEFMDVARAHIDASGGLFQIRPHKEFSPVKGRERMLSLRLLSQLSHQDDGDLPASSDVASTSSNTDNTRGNAYDFMRRRQEANGGDPTLRRWNASIRLSNFTSVDSSPLCIASVGALLDHLVRERAVNDLEDEGIAGLEVRDIEAFSLDQVMQINADALFSLQVFENESHASVHSDKTKEGLSLFGTLNNTNTTLGRALLRTWLLRPSLSLSTIKARHDAVACFLSPENLVTCVTMGTHLKGIKNVPRILEIMRSGKAKMPDWQSLVKFTFHSAMLRDNLTELYHVSGVEVVKKLVAALDIASFRDVGNRINEIIDWEESANSGRICVRPHIDEELDNRKHVYHGIDAVLSKVAEQICQTVPPDYAASLNIVYFPQLGFLICVPTKEESPEEVEILDGWSFQFSSESHVYFKSQEMTDMDTHIGDLHPSIVDREIEIVQELLEEISVQFEAMATACDICAELDVLLAFASAANGYEWTRPEMVEENVIDIQQGRHPLQEQVVDTFVPNDAHLAGGCGEPFGAEWNSVLLCTGANACGKSVYLKQVALIQYMAQVFVPAESATLGIVDKIFTRISTRESVSKLQSAFMIDLNQVSLALRNSTKRSLILLDEFGKGTLSTDGAGLFCGVLAATHFHDVFREDLLDPDAPITFVHMQVMFSSSSGNVLDPRCKSGVAEGLCLDSHAARCAEMFGVPSRIVQRAQHVSHLISTHELGQLLDEEMTEKEREDLADAEVVCRRFLQWNLEGDGEGTSRGGWPRCLGGTMRRKKRMIRQ
ncbi:DNA mismatch repair protein MutS [Roridomyces roridus]|uniref:DNA mismatch repair protein MutS n=1 Tax=Roridomyces roridus TaxID=1738132 RepID=A0AAD7CBD0_9AGAR|nr:DNA mismatch repair protein MutS [Roridomyces roridus]